MDQQQQIAMLRRAAEIAGLKPTEVILPDDRQLIVGSMRFHYLDWGGRGHPLLFLHGGGLNAHTWDVVALMLCKGFRCIALDQRGHGDSEWSPEIDYGPETQMRDVAGFIDTLNLESPVLLGQSMGGLNAMAYAVGNSDRLRGLVIVDVGPEIEATGAQRIRDFSSTPELDSLEAFLERAVKFNPLRDPEVLRRSLFYNLRQLPNGKWAFKHDQRRASDDAWQRNAAQRDRIAKSIGAITCPTLIVRGARSDILSDEAAESFARSLPRARAVTVPDAGHNVQGDNPSGLLDALLPFLKEIGIRKEPE